MSSDEYFGDLFSKNGEAYARHADPDTSKDAAKSMEGKPANKLEYAIWCALKAHPLGLTNLEICGETSLEWNTATPRIAPLRRKGLIYDSGERRAGSSNRKQIVWKAL